MNICIIGIGGVGGYFGGKLAYSVQSDPASSKIYFIARGKHLEVIQRSGITVKSSDGRILYAQPALVSDNFDDVLDTDVFIVCVKGYDLDAISNSLGEVVTEDTVVLPLLNGIDIRERMRIHLRKGIILPACTYVSSRIEEPGTVIQTGKVEKIILGFDPDDRKYRPDDLLELFQRAKIPYEWNENPYPAIWEKYLFIASFALVTARFNKTFGEILKEEPLQALVRDIMEEIYRVALAKGIALHRDIVNASMRKAETFPENTRTSLQLDIRQKKKKSELSIFGETLVHLGKEYNVPTPVSERIYSELTEQL